MGIVITERSGAAEVGRIRVISAGGPLMDSLGKIQRGSQPALFERLFAASPDGIVVVDRSGCIQEANPRIVSLFGYEPSELLGSQIEVLIPERFRASHAVQRHSYEKGPLARPMGTGMELYGRRKDGSEFPVDIMLSPVQTDTGSLVLCVIRDITERKRLEEELKRLVSSDPLTGLGNYRPLHEAFAMETKRYPRTGRSAALILLDVDSLKKINDVHGHLVGSRALCRVADVLRAECRAIDTPVRHGGDEFAVVMPDTDAEGAQKLAHRLVSRLANDGGDPPISFSYGVATYPQDGKSLDEILAVADRSLYEMKNAKRREQRSLPKSNAD